jgi:hypothetical protein
MGLGVVLGFLFGVPPGYLIDTGFLSHGVEKEVSESRIFIVVASFWGYATILLAVGLALHKVISAGWERKRREESIRMRYFPESASSVDLETLKELTGLTEDEILRLWPCGKQRFNQSDYRRALGYAVEIGVRRNAKAERLFRM